jgi:hypothetical protein
MFGLGGIVARAAQVSAAYATPTLSILTNTATLDPVLQILVDDEFKAGHTIELQRDTSDTFATAQLSSILMDSTRRSAARATTSLGLGTSGTTYYYRARHYNNPFYSNWSATVSHTLSAPSALTDLTYVQGFTLTHAGILNTGTYRDRIVLPREAASANCYLVFAVSGLPGFSGDVAGYRAAYVDMNNGQGPIAATILAASTYASRHQVAIFAAPVTGGSLANIELFSNVQLNDYAIVGGLVFNMKAPPALQTAVVGPTSASGAVTTSAVTIPANGMALAAFGVDQTGANTWNNGFTQQGSAQGTNTCEIATLSTPGSVTPSVTRASTRVACMAVAVLEKAA